jgi:5'-deoxynucleotidase YfbR-like HD superfamily hydrolase
MDDGGKKDKINAESAQETAVARFIFELGQLRFEERRGWSRLRLKPENVAEHSLRAAQIAYFLAESEGGVDPHYVLSLLVFHDISEIRTGDADLVAKYYAAPDERRAVRDQTGAFGRTGEKILGMWEEVRAAKTLAGRIARDADLLEMAFTAKELMHGGHAGAQKWLDSAGEHLTTGPGKRLFEALRTTTPDDWWENLRS